MIGKIINKRYRIVEKKDEGGICSVYLAHDQQENRNVAARILKSEVISDRLEDIIHFHNEADIISKLNHPNIVKLYEIGNIANKHCIIMEYVAGCSLYSMIKNGNRFTVDQTVEIILQLCPGLEHIHQANVIHRDLKPGNIMIEYEGKEVDSLDFRQVRIKLIDFGLAQIKELTQIKNKQDISGTFCYMAPEQFHHAGSGIEESGDLYSLGVMFYQLLTGRLPFDANDISSIIHQHVAKKPEFYVEDKEAIPPVIQEIVLRLLEKEPELRYQTAKGLMEDLKKVKNGSPKFQLETFKKPVRLTFRSRFIGRKPHMDRLKKLHAHLVKGHGSLCLIKGKSGVGKTRLVEEFKRYVIAQGSIFISGKCYDNQNKAPYGPFRDSLNSYVKGFRHYSNDKRSQVSQEIHSLVGDLGQILLRLNPTLYEVIGEHPPLVPLEHEKENKRFLLIAAHFFQSLGEIDNNLVLFIDDVQWMDRASFDLLSELVHKIDEFRLLIIAAYRDNEISIDHDIHTLIQQHADSQSPFHQLSLEPFNLSETAFFISSLLGGSDSVDQNICDQIFQKSKGYPFFTIELLKQLVNEDSLVSKYNRWQTSAVRDLQLEMPKSLAEMLLNKITLLTEKEHSVLAYASIIGNAFNVDLLCHAGKNLIRLSPENPGNFQLDEKEVVAIVDKAIEMQLLEKEIQGKGVIRFAHDKIKEAFYHSVSQEKRKAFHHAIARDIENKNSQNTDEVLFDLANHYWESGDKNKALTYTYPAALKANDNYANDDAIRYFRRVVELLEDNSHLKSEVDSRTLDDCLEKLGELYLTIGNYTEASSVLKNAIKKKRTSFGKAEIYEQLCRLYLKKGDFKRCEKYGRKSLKMLGETLPFHKFWVIAGIVKEILSRIFSVNLPGIDRFNDPEITRKYKMYVQIHESIVPMYILYDVTKWLHASIRTLNIAHRKLGPSEEYVLSYNGYALIFMVLTFFKRTLRMADKNLLLAEKLNFKTGIAQIHFTKGVCYFWCGQFNKAIDYLQQSIDIHKRIGDIREIGFVIKEKVIVHRWLAEFDQAIKENNIYYNIARLTDDAWAKSVAFFLELMIANDRGEVTTTEAEILKQYDASSELGMIYCSATIELGRYYQGKGQLEKALTCFRKAKYQLEKNDFMPQYVAHVYSFLAEVLIEKLNLSNNRKEIAGIQKELKGICKNALRKTKRWKTQHGSALLINAEYHALQGINKKSERLFKQSIELNKQMGIKYEYARSCFKLGVFLDNLNRKTASLQWIGLAYKVFEEIGSRQYLEKAREMLGIIEQERSVNRLREKLRLSSILEASRSVGSILNPQELLEKILSISLQITHAQRGRLFVKDDSTGELETLASKNITSNDGTKAEDEVSQSIIEKVFRSGKPILSSNAAKDAKLADFKSVYDYNLKSILCIPIRLKNEIKGVCYLDNPLYVGAFLEEDIETLEAILLHGALSIDKTSFSETDFHNQSNQQNQIHSRFSDAEKQAEPENRLDQNLLSKREIEVLSLISLGYVYSDIAEKLNISPHTVRRHIENIYKKLKVHSRSEAIAKGRESNLL